MLHILLTILKIIGIVLVVLIGFVLLALFTMLFIPVCYKVKGSKNEKELEGCVRISWLFRLVYISAGYENKTVSYKVRICGIDLFELRNLFKKKKKELPVQKPKENLDEVKKDSVDKSVGREDTNHTIKKNTTDEKQYKILCGVKKIKLTLCSICDRIKYLKDFLEEDVTKESFYVLKGQIIGFIKHVFPKKIKGWITFGLEDPCSTGQVLAAIYVFYPLFYKSFQIYPDFANQIFEGNIKCSGRIYGCYLIKTVLYVYFNKNIQSMIHRFQNKEAA